MDKYIFQEDIQSTSQATDLLDIADVKYDKSSEDDAVESSVDSDEEISRKDVPQLDGIDDEEDSPLMCPFP